MLPYLVSDKPFIREDGISHVILSLHKIKLQALVRPGAGDFLGGKSSRSKQMGPVDKTHIRGRCRGYEWIARDHNMANKMPWGLLSSLQYRVSTTESRSHDHFAPPLEIGMNLSPLLPMLEADSIVDCPTEDAMRRGGRKWARASGGVEMMSNQIAFDEQRCGGWRKASPRASGGVESSQVKSRSKWYQIKSIRSVRELEESRPSCIGWRPSHIISYHITPNFSKV